MTFLQPIFVCNGGVGHGIENLEKLIFAVFIAPFHNEVPAIT